MAKRLNIDIFRPAADWPICTKFCSKTQNFTQSQTNDRYLKQESHAVAGKPRDAAVNSDRYQQPVGQKQSECETENIT